MVHVYQFGNLFFHTVSDLILTGPRSRPEMHLQRAIGP
jgi:hypothetical protein